MNYKSVRLESIEKVCLEHVALSYYNNNIDRCAWDHSTHNFLQGIWNITNGTHRDSQFVQTFCYLALAFILFIALCFSLSFTLVFPHRQFYRTLKIIFCNEHFATHTLLSHCINVWIPNGINIRCCCCTPVYYYIFCCCFFRFGYFILLLKEHRSFVFVHRSIYLASSIDRLNILHVTIYGLCTRHA